MNRYDEPSVRVPSSVRSTTPDVLLVNPVRGAPGTRGSDTAPVPYLDTIPPSYLFGLFHFTFPAEPLYFCQVGGQLRKVGLEVELLDGFTHRLLPEELSDVVMAFDTEVYLFAAFHNTVRDALAMARRVKDKNPRAKTVFGGAYVTKVWERLVREPEVDFVVVGDGELAAAELCSALREGGPVRAIPGVARMIDGQPSLTPAEPITELDQLAWPIRDLVPLVKRHDHGVSMYSSRGCAFGKCSFCYLVDYQKIGRQPLWRHRSAEDVVDEMEYLVREFGIDHITFVDEDWIGTDDEGVARCVRIAELLIERKVEVRYYINALVKGLLLLLRRGHLPLLARSGLDSVFVGFESTNKKRLVTYIKPQSPAQYPELIDGLLAHGVRINPGLITFDPSMDLDELRANIKLAERMRYYDLFLFSRLLVDLGDDYIAGRNPPQGGATPPPEEVLRPTSSPGGWRQAAEDQHDSLMRSFRSAAVAATFQAMRLYIHYAFPLYQDVCGRGRAVVQERRRELIEFHYDSASRAAEWAEGKTAEELTFEAVDAWVQDEIRRLDHLLKGGAQGAARGAGESSWSPSEYAWS